MKCFIIGYRDYKKIQLEASLTMKKSGVITHHNLLLHQCKIQTIHNYRCNFSLVLRVPLVHLLCWDLGTSLWFLSQRQAFRML